MAGPIDYFEDYQRRKGVEIVRIDHPLDDYANRMSVLTQNGLVIRSWKRSARGPISLVWDLFATIVSAIRAKPSVAVGANNFDTFGLLLSRWLRFSERPRVVYLAADYSEDRFTSPVMNWIYLKIERTVLRHADVSVSNTLRARNRRLDLGLDIRRSLVVPNGVRLEQPAFRPRHIRKDTFIFVGSVTREHGLYELVRTLKPRIHSLTVIGQGEDWDRLIQLCEDQTIPLRAEHNWSHDAVMDYLRDFCGFGLAPYNRQSKWTHYASPLKIAEYVASGVPVIMSTVPEIADTVRTEQLGVVYDDLNRDELGQMLDRFDETQFHLRAQRFYSEYNSDSLYGRLTL